MSEGRDRIAQAVPLAGGTKIEWADFTFNPWWGCERVSPACAHCYADTLSKRYAAGKQLWGAGHEFRFFGDGHWEDPLKWARLAPTKLGRRPRVFCASMADVFEDRPELEEHRERLFTLIVATPELDWLVLTKRPEFARDWLGASAAAYANLWLGVSIENSRFTWRADVLREIPVAVRFISAEPLLGSLFTNGVRYLGDGFRGKKALDLGGIGWIIIGGESGPKSRPFHLEHAREIIRHCYTLSEYGHRPALFVKQLGAKPTVNELEYGLQAHYGDGPYQIELNDRKGGNIEKWPADLRIREHPASVTA